MGDNWQDYKDIIARNMLVQARSGLINILQKRAEPEPQPTTNHITYKNTWKMCRVNAGEEIPSWAERGWVLDNLNEKSNPNSSLEELALEWAHCTKYTEIPGNIIDYYRKPGTTVCIFNKDMIVFANYVKNK